MSTDPGERIRADVVKLRALQPGLSRDQALFFFTRFHPEYPTTSVADCVNQLIPPPAPVPPRKRQSPAARPKRASSPAPEGAPKAGSRRSTPPAAAPNLRVACLVCGKDVSVTPRGTTERHKKGKRSCAGSRKPVPTAKADAAAARARAAHAARYQDHTGIPRGELAPSDQDWLNNKGWLTPLGSAQPGDVVTARRILLAASNGHLPPDETRQVQTWYQSMKRRADLFNPKATPRDWPEESAGDPHKKLDAIATPGKKVYYREVLVGKRN